MKAATFRPFLFTKPYSDGLHPVYIRIYQNRKSSYVSTGHEIPRGAWNSEKSELWVSKANVTWKLLESMTKEELKKFREKQGSIIILPNAARINSDIRHKVQDLESLQKGLISNQQEINVKILKILADKKISRDEVDFLKYIEGIIKRKYNEKHLKTSEKYSLLLRKLTELRKNKTLPVGNLTADFLNDFHRYLVKKGYHQNYIHNILKSLKSLIQKEAIVRDRLLPPEKNPFIWFTMPGTIKPVNEKLTLEEIRLIESLDLEKHKPIFHVRNSFIFSFYCAGISIGDLMQLKWLNITDYGRLNYYPGQKENERSIKLVPEAVKILGYYKGDTEMATDYIFPFLTNNSSYSCLSKPEDFRDTTPKILTDLLRDLKSKVALYNRKLKEIAVKTGIRKKITSSTSRHSFADIASQKISVYEIQKILGHSGFRVTEVYLKSLDHEAIDHAIEKVFH